MTNVSSPDEISALFADAHDNFPAINGKPSDNNVQRLRRRNFQALQDIDLGDGSDAMCPIFLAVDHKVESTISRY